MPNGNGHSSHFLTLPHWNYPVKLKGLSGLYLNTVFRNVANGLIGIFIPIYVYKIIGDYSLVFLYYAIFRLSATLATVPVAFWIHKVGPDISMLFSNFARSGYFALLIAAKFSPSLIWLAPIFGGSAIPLYWLPYHTAFAKADKKGKIQKQVTQLSNITRLVAIATPLAGGFIAQQLGFNVLFPMGIVLLLASTIPVFLDEYNKKTKTIPLEKMTKEILLPQNKNLFLAFFFEGFRIVADAVAWPLMLYLALPQLEEIGGLKTFTLLLSLILVNLCARKIKKFKVAPLALGNIGRSILWTIRGISLFPVTAVLSDPAYELATVFVNFPYNLLVYQTGKEKSLSFFTERELAISSGTFSACLLAYFLLKGGFSWPAIVLLAIWGIGLSTFFMTRHKQENLKLKYFKIKVCRL